MATTWIVAADESRARVLQVTGRERRLQEIEDFVNPQARFRDRELDTDALGRFPGGHTGEPDTGPVEHAATVFAREVGRYLERARQDRRFEELVLAAPPKFLGLLRRELGKLVTDELAKDISRLETHELEKFFEKGSGRAP